MPHSYVIVWANNVITTGHGWPGHAALNIGPLTFRRFTCPDDYVSWWPKAETDAKTVKKSNYGFGVEFVADDICREGYLPDYIFKLDSSTDQILNMRACWKAIRRKNDAHYRLWAKNCSTIVARVLRAGGYSAGMVSGVWYDHSTIWTPLKIAELVSRAGGTLMTWKEFQPELDRINVEMADLVVENDSSRKGQTITVARDKRFCKCEAPCRF